MKRPAKARTVKVKAVVSRETRELQKQIMDLLQSGRLSDFVRGQSKWRLLHRELDTVEACEAEILLLEKEIAYREKPAAAS